MDESRSRSPSARANNHGHQNSQPDPSQKRPESTRPADPAYLAPARINALNRKDSSISESGSAPDSLLDLYGTNTGASSMDHGERIHGDIYATQEDPEHSRWIHRDKLARIESQELQAAGIILPRSRAASKASRREHSRDKQGNGHRSEQAQSRQRIESLPTEEEEEGGQESMNWDLRMPEEAAEDQEEGFQDVSGGVKGVSRIPVSKSSPIPIPIQHLERDTPIRRKQSEQWAGEDDVISSPRMRGRSESVKVLEDSQATPTPPANRAASGSSPKKAARKGSGPTTRAASTQRPKTRSASNRDGPAQRPPTRSGDSGSGSSTKRPEGDPPWLATMYKPDPRLPPDQQLLPTVAKRLQQEQWKKDGKIANAYDTSFEPLNDEGFPPPGPAHEPVEVPEQKPEEHGAEWPLRGPKSPTLSTGRPGTAGGYSTMPKISSAPQPQEAVSSPLVPVRIQEPPTEAKKAGCGCCVVM